MRKADTHFYFAGGFFGKYMNYGKEATEKKIDLIYSRKKKYTTRVILTFFLTREKLFLAFIMNRCTKGAVRLIFDKLEHQLGT